jgi:multidrug efflux system membrane fusion protein
MKRVRIIFLGLAIALIAGFYAYPRIIASKAADAAVPAGSGSVEAGSGTHASKGTGGGGGGAGGGGRSAPVAVVSAVAESEDVPVTQQAVGWAEPIASVAVKTRMDGMIIDQAVTDGQVVKKGDLLFKLDDAALQATIAKDQASIAKDQASLDQANSDLKRDLSLSGGKSAVVTEQQVEQQQALVKADEAAIAIDRAVLQADQVAVSYATITAPIAGRIGVVNASPGNFVRSADATPLLTITQMAPLRVSYTVPQRVLADYRKALAGPDPVLVDALDATTGAKLAEGKLTFIDSSIDTTSGTVVLKADFPNENGALWPGAYVNLTTQLGVMKSATVVPVIAIQQGEQGAFVYVVKDGGKAAKVPVKVATTKGDQAVISDGVKPGDHVVTEGQLRLTDGAPVKETVGGGGKPATTADAGATP